MWTDVHPYKEAADFAPASDKKGDGSTEWGRSSGSRYFHRKHEASQKQGSGRSICVRHGSTLAHVGSTEEAAALMGRLNQKQTPRPGDSSGDLHSNGTDGSDSGSSVAGDKAIADIIKTIRIATAKATGQRCPT